MTLLLAIALALMPQPWGQLQRRSHEIVMGAPGCGKTPYVVERVASARRVVFWDGGGDFARLTEAECIPASALTDRDLVGEYCRVVVVPSDKSDADEFRHVVELCREARGEDGLVLVVDEAGALSGPGECMKTLNGLHAHGHKDGVATILVSPSATDFPKRCRDTATRVACYWQKSADDVATLDREYTGTELGTRAHAWRFPDPPVVWVSPVLHGG